MCQLGRETSHTESRNIQIFLEVVIWDLELTKVWTIIDRPSCASAHESKMRGGPDHRRSLKICDYQTGERW